MQDMIEPSIIVLFHSGFNQCLLPVARVNRSDVAKKYFNTSADYLCGFECKIIKAGKYQIFLEIKGVKYIIADINVLPLSIESDEMLMSESRSAWRKFSASEYEAITISESASVVKLSSTESIRDLVRPIASIYARDFSAIQHSEIARVDFVDAVFNNGFCAQAAAKVAESGWLVIPSPYEDGVATCTASFTFPGYRNVLVFKTACGEVFFLMQQALSNDAVFLPKRGVLLNGRYNFSSDIEDMLVAMTGNFPHYIEYLKVSNPSRCYGFIAGYPRPFHFLYDTCYGLYNIEAQTNNIGLIRFYTYKGAEYVELSTLFPINITQKEDFYDITALAQHENSFCFVVGSDGVAATQRDLVNRLDSLILEKVSSIELPTTAEFESFSLGRWPILWFGITSDKRKWLEQEEGIPEICNQLRNKYNGLCVVIDGWTSSISHTQLDRTQSSLDEVVFNNIVKNLDPEIPVFSTIGFTSAEKIIIATHVTAFVANHSTGSIHVSRLARRPGVTHLSNAFTNGISDHQIHHNIIRVSQNHVVDVKPESGGEKVDFISYSINPEVILDCVDCLISQDIQPLSRYK